MSTLTVDTIKILTQQSHDGLGIYNDNPVFAVQRNFTTTYSMTFASASTDITYDAATLNPNTMVNLATGVATIPVAGIWLFGGVLSLSHSSLYHFDFGINVANDNEPPIVMDRPSSWANGEFWMSGSITRMASVAAGQTAKIQLTYANILSGTATNVTIRCQFWGLLIRRV